MKSLSKKSILSLLLAVSAVTISALADDGPQLQSYTYRVDVPAGSQSCITNAQAIAASFAKATAPYTQSVTGSCQTRQAVADAAGYQEDTVIVSYTALGEMVPAPTVLGGSIFQGIASAQSGLFPTYADCVNAIPNQKALYEGQTGLSAI